MAFTSSTKIFINQFLQYLNLRLDSLTAEKIERDRLETLERTGHFNSTAFPVLDIFKSPASASIIEDLCKYKARFADFEDAKRNDVGYTYKNDFFSSPDTEVLYSIIRKFQPKTLIEVGSGNSTKVVRQAIVDGHLNTYLISIDPYPRSEVRHLADKLYLSPVEAFSDTTLFRSLREHDVLFIDSSHEIRTGNDVVFMYLNVLPDISPGVLIHVHDIFLPYDYPSKWIVEERWGWNEQYLVQALLTYSSMFEVIWAGYYLQRTRDDFAGIFPQMNHRYAKSLWLRKLR